MKFFVYSDNHGELGMIYEQRKYVGCEGPDCGLIILGDAGVNYFANEEFDKRKKKTLNSFGFKVYCVRGNHEMRPEHLPNIKKIFDANVSGPVYYEEEYPNIRYFVPAKDTYVINGLKTLVLNGAYSIDKWYRLMTNAVWFEDEQMSVEEMEANEKLFKEGVDLVLSHTCPLMFQPVDLFLSFVDQSTVDNGMEAWMQRCAEKYSWKYWLFGHYHKDRRITDGVYMMYHTMRPLDDILKLAGEHTNDN